MLQFSGHVKSRTRKLVFVACPLRKQETFRSKNKDWLPMSQDYVSEGATYPLADYCCSELAKRVALVQIYTRQTPYISSKEHVFAMNWKCTHLALNSTIVYSHLLLVSYMYSPSSTDPAFYIVVYFVVISYDLCRLFFPFSPPFFLFVIDFFTFLFSYVLIFFYIFVCFLLCVLFCFVFCLPDLL